jgi:hypothetical protein
MPNIFKNSISDIVIKIFKLINNLFIFMRKKN